MTNEMPDWLPELKPEDFVIGPYDKGCRHCLRGWCQVFDLPYSISCGYSGPLYDAVNAVDPASIGNNIDSRLTGSQRPDTLTNRKLSAEAWSELLRREGYTEDVGTVTL